MKRLIAGIAVGASLINAGCTTIKNPNSLATKGEKVRVELLFEYGPEAYSLPEEPERMAHAQGAGALAAWALPIVVDQATKFISRQLEKESALYAASWAGAASGDRFYPPGPPQKQSDPNLKSIIVMREVVEGVAAEFKFDVVKSVDGFAYRLQPVSAVVHRTKAKLRPKDNDVDVEVTLVVDAFWISTKGEVKNQTVATLKVPLKGLKLGVPKEAAAFNENDSSGWFTIPRSRDAGYGTFTVTVKVDETDEFGERIKAFQEVFDANRANLNELIVSEIQPPNNAAAASAPDTGNGASADGTPEN